MLRQATIHGLRDAKGVGVKYTVLHDTENDVEPVTVGLQIGNGQIVRVQVEDLRSAIADVLPREAS